MTRHERSIEAAGAAALGICAADYFLRKLWGPLAGRVFAVAAEDCDSSEKIRNAVLMAFRIDRFKLLLTPMPDHLDRPVVEVIQKATIEGANGGIVQATATHTSRHAEMNIFLPLGQHRCCKLCG